METKNQLLSIKPDEHRALPTWLDLELPFLLVEQPNQS